MAAEVLSKWARRRPLLHSWYLDGAAADQVREPLGCKASLLQDRGSVRAGLAISGRHRLVAGIARRRRGLDRAERLDESATGTIVRMVGGFIEREHRREAGIDAFKQRTPFLARLRKKQGGQLRLGLRPIGRIARTREIGIIQQSKLLEQDRLEPPLDRGDRDERAVPRFVGIIEQQARAATPIRLSLNESDYGPSPAASRAITAALPDLARYLTDDETDALSPQIAAFEGVSPEQIVLGDVLAPLFHETASDFTSRTTRKIPQISAVCKGAVPRPSR